MRLPEVATRLRELAIDLGCDELSDLADEERDLVWRNDPRTARLRACSQPGGGSM